MYRTTILGRDLAILSILLYPQWKLDKDVQFRRKLSMDANLRRHVPFENLGQNT